MDTPNEGQQLDMEKLGTYGEHAARGLDCMREVLEHTKTVTLDEWIKTVKNPVARFNDLRALESLVYLAKIAMAAQALVLDHSLTGSADAPTT